MGVHPPPPQAPPPRFSPDGMWWWTGSEWKPAISPDRRWRWTGSGWVPMVPPKAPGADTGMVAGMVLAGFGVIVLVSFLLIIVLLTMGNQIKNVFDNVVTALGG